MELNNIGKIVSTHGLKGEVKIKTDSSFISERFKIGNKLYINVDDKIKELIVNSHRSMNGYELVSFVGIDDCDKAMFLKNKDLFGEKDRSLLKDNAVFYSDYIGLSVRYFNNIIGKVTSIETYPQGDYLGIDEDGSFKLVPLRKEFIKSVDLEKMEVVIVDMEGLL